MNRELLHAALTGKWAIRREAIPGLLGTIRADILSTVVTLEAGPYAMDVRTSGPVAVIRIAGTITYRDSGWASWFGTTVERIKHQFRAALADDSITAIVFDVDSPGGVIDGVPELAAEIFKSRGRKPIIAVSNTVMCSAAYWIACQADEIVVSPSSESGSIGVWTMHADVSKMLDMMGIDVTVIFAGEHKVDGHPWAPLSDEVRADIQKSVDDAHTEFLTAVAKARGTSASDVRKTYGQGRVYSAKDAVKIGLADRIATLDDVLTKLAGRRGSAGARAEHHEQLDPPAPVAAAAESTGCGCSDDCPCVDGGLCPDDCETCQDGCPCQEQRAQAAAQIAADVDAAAAAVAIAERL